MPTGVVITTLIGVFTLILFRIISWLRGVIPIAAASLHRDYRDAGVIFSA
jgi:hypothetical protein